jgi:hypothetical protein
VQELEVVLLEGEVLVNGRDGGVDIVFVCGGCGPEDVVVVGEEREEDA